MSGGRVIFHFNDVNHLVEIDDFNNITAGDLLETVQRRIYGNDNTHLLVSRDYLCEGSHASQPLNDVRLREIAKMVQKLTVPRAVHLWLFNDMKNGFLFENSSTTSEQHNLGDTRPGDNNGNSEDTHFGTSHIESCVAQPLCTEIDLVQNTSNQYTDDAFGQLFKNAASDFTSSLAHWGMLKDEDIDAYLDSLGKPSESGNTSNESSNENAFKFTNDFRREQRKQYKTDVSSSNQKKKTENDKQKVCEKPENEKRKVCENTENEKRKVCENTKKYGSHLQANKFKKGCPSGRYPCVQPSKHYQDLIRKGQSVSVYIAAIKYINGRRCLDALKGFLVNANNPKIPLENPCIIEFVWTDKTKPLPEDYPLKLVLIQVSGDINRKSTITYDENFNFAQRTVDEKSKYSCYNTTDDIDEPEEFQIAVVPAKGDALLEADWSMLIESNLMHYVTRKSNKKQKTNSSVAASSDQEQRPTTQEDDEEDNDDDDEK